MNQNKSAAGLRRSAVAERIRLRDEWSALKGYDTKSLQQKEPRFVSKKIKRKPKPITTQSGRYLKPVNEVQNVKEHVAVTSEVLKGIVALVDVGAESRALALRAALTALGATVVPAWNPLVTHLIWSQGGSRETRAKARALASRLVSPLWVEGCAASGSRLPEQAFPAPTRASDLPSPRTLRQLLKRYDMENIPLNHLLSDSDDMKKNKQLRLRWSSDTSADKTADKSGDTSADKTNIGTRVNTLLHRALPLQSLANPPTQQKKSRRKLFTQKEVVSDSSEHNSDAESATRKPSSRSQRNDSELRLTQRERRDLAKAERIARKMLLACTARTNPVPCTATSDIPRIVLTGMNRLERRTVSEAVRALGARLQGRVNKKTTHVLLGSCVDAAPDGNQTSHTIGHTSCRTSQSNACFARTFLHKPRTVNALEGAARGCRVLNAGWATESHLQGRWIHHAGYEVHHLRKISQKARFERSALGLQRSEYVYDVFNGARVRVTANAEQKDSARRLLELCGAVLVDSEPLSDVTNQHGGGSTADCDVTIGVKLGEISSKWVFDSVAAGRIRTTRRYVNISTAGIDRRKIVR